MKTAYFWEPKQFSSSFSSLNASSYWSSEAVKCLASRRHTNALPVAPSDMGMGMACSTFITVLFDAIGVASVMVRRDSIASTRVAKFVS